MNESDDLEAMTAQRESRLDGLLESIDHAARLWSRVPPKGRAQALTGLGHLIAERQVELAHVIAEETRKPITEVITQEITATLEMLRYFQRKYPRWLRPRRFLYPRPGFWSKTNSIRFEPLGVIAIIGPSNFPFSLPMMQASAALLCGNGVVLKSSEKCPSTSSLIRELFESADLPFPVVRTIDGAGDVAESLISHPLVRKVVFTGSSQTGRSVAHLCGRHLKPSVLELGGEGPAIVCNNANIVAAARGLIWSTFYADGRSCVGTRRVFAENRIYPDLLKNLRDELALLCTGDPHDPDVDVSAQPLSSGTVPGFESSVAPTASPTFLSVRGADCRGSDTELRIDVINSTDDAVAAVNSSPFGLGASVWSRSRTEAKTIAEQLRVGMVWINDSSVGLPRFPWGGRGESGWGRLYSIEALPELTNVKVISHDHRISSRRKFWWYPYSKEKFDVTVTLNNLFFRPFRWRELRSFVISCWRFLGRAARSNPNRSKAGP